MIMQQKYGTRAVESAVDDHVTDLLRRVPGVGEEQQGIDFPLGRSAILSAVACVTQVMSVGIKAHIGAMALRKTCAGPPSTFHGDRLP